MKVLSEGRVFRHFDGVVVSTKNQLLELYFDDESFLFITPDNKISINGKFDFAKNSKIGDIFQTINGIKTLIYICKTKKKELVYDIVNVKCTNNYFANNTLIKNCVYLDEFAFIQNDVKFYESTYPVISSGKNAKIIITSTPKGMNLFYKLWRDAISKKNSFIPLEFNWRRHPKRNEEWMKETIKNTSQSQFSQEFECLKGDSFITIKDIQTKEIKTITIKELYDILK